jgi:hypothetical protein
MSISKLTAPAPHELVRKVNELVDAANSGGGGECAGGLKIAAFNTPCSTLARITENTDEGGWNVELGFNVTDNGDGTITLSDFGFTYDLNATFFRDYWILMQDGDYTERFSIATFLDGLVRIGLIKPNPQYGMGVVSGSVGGGYTYIGFLSCECPADTEDSSPLQDLMGFLSISYLQIGYAVPTVTEYEYTGGMLRMAGRTVKSTPIRQTLQDRLNAIREARNNNDI